MENPYQIPNQEPQPQAQNEVAPLLGTELTVSQFTVAAMTKSTGWARFISILGFIWFGMLCIVFIYYLFILQAFFGGFSPGSTSGLFWLFGLLAILYAGSLLFLSLRLTRYAGAIGRLGRSFDPHDFEAVAIAQLKFWRLSGIIMTICILIKLATWAF